MAGRARRVLFVAVLACVPARGPGARGGDREPRAVRAHVAARPGRRRQLHGARHAAGVDQQAELLQPRFLRTREVAAHQWSAFSPRRRSRATATHRAAACRLLGRLLHSRLRRRRRPDVVRSTRRCRLVTRDGQHGPGWLRHRPGLSLVFARRDSPAPGRADLCVHRAGFRENAVRPIPGVPEAGTGARRRRRARRGRAGSAARAGTVHGEADRRDAHPADLHGVRIPLPQVQAPHESNGRAAKGQSHVETGPRDVS